MKATLDSGKMVKATEDSDSDDDEEEFAKGQQLTDDQLFKACGGMTAHK